MKKATYSKTLRFWSLLFAASLAVASLAGCGNAANDSSNTNSGSTSTVSTADNDKSSDDSSKSDSGSEETTETVTIKGITDLTPHSELINYVIPKLKEQGVNVELVSTAADATTNEKLANGEIDFNFFQHLPYLNSENEINGWDLVSAGDIHVEPITAYSDKYQTVDEIPDGAVVAIPNDGTNEYRALKILEENGFIELDSSVQDTLSADTNSITNYIKNITIIEQDSAQIIPTKEDYDFFITNTNKALEAKITSNKLFSEGAKDNPYANIIAVRKEDKDNEAIRKLVAALQSEDTRKYIEETYNGAVIPVESD